MERILFDCSQFITFNANLKELKDEDVKSIFINRGFDVEINDEIDCRKSLYFLNEFLKFTIEIVDKEFIGEFDDWKDINKIPLKIKKIADATGELVNLLRIKEYKIILVDRVSSLSNRNTIEKKVFENKDLIEILFYVPRSNYGSYWNYNMYIFSHKSD